MAERFLYLPLAGSLLFLGDAVRRRVPHRTAAAVLAGGVLCLWTVESWQRSGIWKDNLTLFVLSVRNGPKCRRVENNVVAATLALPHMKKALAPGATAKLDTEDWKRVFATLDQLRDLVPDNGGVYCAFGVAFARLGDRAKAVANYKKAVELAPDDALAWANLAALHLGEGAMEKARFELLRALADDVNRVEVRVLLAEWYERCGQTANAARVCRWTLRDHPNNAEARELLRELSGTTSSSQRSSQASGAIGEAAHEH